MPFPDILKSFHEDFLRCHKAIASLPDEVDAFFVEALRNLDVCLNFPPDFFPRDTKIDETEVEHRSSQHESATLMVTSTAKKSSKKRAGETVHITSPKRSRKFLSISDNQPDSDYPAPSHTPHIPAARLTRSRLSAIASDTATKYSIPSEAANFPDQPSTPSECPIPPPLDPTQTHVIHAPLETLPNVDQPSLTIRTSTSHSSQSLSTEQPGPESFLQPTAIATAAAAPTTTMSTTTTTTTREISPIRRLDSHIEQSVVQLPNAQPKHTSLGGKAKAVATFKKSRPFASTERLGGVCRLASLNTSVSQTDNKPTAVRNDHSISGQLNKSRGVLPVKERSRSVLAAKEQALVEKRKLYESRIKENDEKLRAFQAAKERERQAMKRANEEKRMAVKNKAKQMEDIQRMIMESKKGASAARAKLENDKQKQQENASRSKPQPNVSRLNVLTNVAPKIVGSAAAGNVLRPNQVISNNAVKSAQTSQQTRPRLLTTSQKPTDAAATTVKPVTKTVLQHTNIADKTFDFSQLNSDSDSDEEDKKSYRTPDWSRRGHLEAMHTFHLMKAGKLHFPTKFLSAKQIKFDVKEMFAGYQFRDKPRTSSMIWT